MANQLRGAACLRVSSDEQEKSPDDQLAEIRVIASRDNVVVGATYNDFAVSGDWHDRRDGLKQMIADAAIDKFDVVYLWSQDRFSRADSIEAFAWFQKVRDTGVQIRLLEDGESLDFNDPTVRMKMFMRAEAAQAKVVSDSRHTIKGERARVREGRHKGTIPIGYVRPLGGGSLIINEEQSQHVAEVFRMAANQATNADMIGYLRDNAIVVSAKRLRYMLRNRAYLGELIRFKTTGSKYAHGVQKGKRVKLPESEWSINPQAHEAIIGIDLFDHVQAVLDKRADGCGPKSNYEYALSGMVSCPRCDKNMHGMTERGVRKYKCVGSDHEPHDRVVIKESELLSIVLGELTMQVRPAVEAAIEYERNKNDQAYSDSLGKESDLNAAERLSLRASIESVEADIQHACGNLALVSPELVQHVQKSIAEMQSNLDTLQRQLSRVSEAETPFSRFHRWQQEVVKFDDAWTAIQDYSASVHSGSYDPASMRRGLATMGLFISPEVERLPYGTRWRSEVTGGTVEIKLPGVSIDFARGLVPWLSHESLQGNTTEPAKLPSEIMEAAELMKVRSIDPSKVVDSP